jgi:hypothetical protein
VKAIRTRKKDPFMKKLQSFLGIALCGIILGVTSTASAETAKAGYATVVRVEGLASYNLGDNNWHPLVPGKFIPAGSSIRTGENGVVDVVLGRAVEAPQGLLNPSGISLAADSPVRGMIGYKPSVEQNVIRLTPNTLLTIDKLTTTDTGADTVSDTELDLKKGKIYASVKKLSGASQYLIKIPNGIAGVRGTQFTISADGATAVFETRGSDGLVLSLTLPSGETKTYVIDHGHFYEPGSSEPAVIPANIMSILRDIFAALKTIYIESNGFDHDRTQDYMSGDHGHHHHNIITP